MLVGVEGGEGGKGCSCCRNSVSLDANHKGRVMFILSRVFTLFRDSADADISEESSFKAAFSNVTNVLMLAQSLVLGVNSLINEDAVLASINLLFSLFFVTYFVILYIVRGDRYVNILDRMAMFVYFVIVYISCTRYKVEGITITIYPFIAMILHGRHVGSMLAAVQLGIIVLYYVVAVRLLGFGGDSVPTFTNTLTTVVMQLVSIFIFYVAIRWLTSLVYEKNREVNILSEEKEMDANVISRLSHCIDRPLRDISQATAVLVTERMSAKQSELCEIIRTSSLNAISNLNAVRRAVELSIPIIPAEIKRINLYQLVGSMLRLYRSSDPQAKPHGLTLGGGVPEQLRGNSILTRRVVLNILDALNKGVGLSQSSLSVLITRENVITKEIVLHFCFDVQYNLDLDKREISVSEDHLVDFLMLGVTKRIVESEKGYFNVTSADGGIKIDFTIAFRALEDEEDVLDTEFIDKTKAVLSVSVNLEDATFLVMTDSDILWAKVSSAFEGYCGETLRARSVRETMKIFSSRRVDVVLTDLTSDGGQGQRLVQMVRDAESGMRRSVPVIDLVDPASEEQLWASAHACFDESLSLPFDSDKARNAILQYFV